MKKKIEVKSKMKYSWEICKKRLSCDTRYSIERCPCYEDCHKDFHK